MVRTLSGHTVNLKTKSFVFFCFYLQEVVRPLLDNPKVTNNLQIIQILRDHYNLITNLLHINSQLYLPRVFIIFCNFLAR